MHLNPVMGIVEYSRTLTVFKNALFVSVWQIVPVTWHLAVKAKKVNLGDVQVVQEHKIVILRFEFEI